MILSLILMLTLANFVRKLLVPGNSFSVLFPLVTETPRLRHIPPSSDQLWSMLPLLGTLIAAKDSRNNATSWRAFKVSLLAMPQASGNVKVAASQV